MKHELLNLRYFSDVRNKKSNMNRMKKSKLSVDYPDPSLKDFANRTSRLFMKKNLQTMFFYN